MISSSATTVIGFSLEGNTIPAGEGVLVILDVEGDADAACLSGLVLSDSDGNALDATVEHCISIKISETIEKSSHTFTVLFINDQGLNVGDPVDMLGEKIGEVSHTNFMEHKNAVELSIDNSYAFSIPLDSEFEVKVDSLFGRYISITPGYNIKDFILPGEIIKGLRKFDFDDKSTGKSGNLVNTFYNTSWAVIIGINEYENLMPLRFAFQDAREIQNLLISNFGFPKKNIKLLIDKAATLKNIRDDLYEIAGMANEKDRILVYFAGLGETKSLKNGVDKGYLIPTDGNIDKIFSTCLPMTEIKEIANLTVAKHVLFLMDACFSGLATVNTRGIDRSTEGYIEKIVRDQARQIITAGGKKDKVIEKDEWGHSAFAKNLIQGLKSAVADQDYDGYITADELGSFLQKRVTIDSEYLQTPLKARFGSGEGEFVFLARKIIESAIINIIPHNIYEKNAISSEAANQLHQSLIDAISVLYGDDVSNNILRDLARLKKERDQAIQFIYGCTDEGAINYNPNANLDDESCIILDSDDVYIRFGDFHNRDSTLDVFIASNRRIYNLEILTEGFEIVDVLDGNLGLDNINTSFELEEIYVEFSDSQNGYIIPKDETLLFKAKIIPIDKVFCFRGLTINENDTTNVQLGECKASLLVQELALTDMIEVEILSGEYAKGKGTILQTTVEGKYNILLEDSTIVEDVDPSEVNKLNQHMYSGNHLWILDVDYSTNTMELGVHAIDDLAGYQLNVEGVSIDAAYGGASEGYGFTIPHSTDMVLAFSMEADMIAAGEYTLIKIDFTTLSNKGDEICLTNVIFAGYQGEALDLMIGDCWVH